MAAGQSTSDRLLSFSEWVDHRLGVGMDFRGNRWSRPPENDEIYDLHDMNKFQNQIPPIDDQQTRLSLIRPLQHESTTESYHDGVDAHRENLLTTLLWPTVVICIPISILSAALLALVFAYEITPKGNLFQPSLSPEEYKRQSYILVNFPASTFFLFSAPQPNLEIPVVEVR